MRLLIFISFLFSTTLSHTQSITAVQEKALNNYVTYANKSADEVTAVVTSIIEYYSNLHRKNYVPRYTCPVQLEDYYLTKATSDSKVLGLHASVLQSRLTSLRAVAESIDSKCKALDTYHKLEDYKQDNFVKAELLIRDLQQLILVYNEKQFALNEELETVYKKLTKSSIANAYAKTDLLMRQEIEIEKQFINTWNFNLKAEVHSGWADDKIEASILETKKQNKSFEPYKPILKYPTSSMYSSFMESATSILEIKRRGLDEYNFEAKKSDKHSNQVYLALINYFNGALLADYNTFIEFAEGDGYYGLKAINYVPVFEIRTQQKDSSTETKTFQDIPYTSIQPSPQKITIPKTVFASLTQYVDFINEAHRQLTYLQQVLRNLNSSATYYKDLPDFKGKGGLYYEYKNYQLPLSIYQYVIDDSQVLTTDLKKSLNDQATVLLSILKEMNQLSASLETETGEKRYEKDNLKNIFGIIERNDTLFKIFDEKKERLYNDVRTIYNTYAQVNPNDRWYVSGKALRLLIDYDQEALFEAKKQYNKNSTAPISTDKIDNTVRDIIANEYTNMKGIEKLGRYNGNCPYTPYEDIPQVSKRLLEKITTLKPVSSSSYQHPYHDLVYLYNEAVDDMNKFCELSKNVLLLKVIKQPELFDTKYPGKKENSNIDALSETNQINTHSPVKPIKEKPVAVVIPQNKTKVIHDTIYIEKRDTIYMGIAGENFGSMEGFANNNMVLLLDVSGSMNAPGKLPLLKSSVLNLLAMMRKEDEVSIVVYSGNAKILLNPTSFKEENKIRDVIDKLRSEGKTDGNAGLKLAYKVADNNYIRGGNNRIILATDGEFPISNETYELVEKFSKNDIFISVFNFGKSSVSSKNLNRLASTGKGNYEYITKENVERKLIREAKSKRSK